MICFSGCQSERYSFLFLDVVPNVLGVLPKNLTFLCPRLNDSFADDAFACLTYLTVVHLKSLKVWLALNDLSESIGGFLDCEPLRVSFNIEIFESCDIRISEGFEDHGSIFKLKS